MARAIWAGAISLGMVSIPVRLFPATRKRDLRFRELDRVTGRRVRHERVRQDFQFDSPPAGPAPTSPRTRVGDLFVEPPLAREVAAEDVVKGYEVSPGRFVTVERDELMELEPERSRTIDVELFVESATVDPIYFDAAYHAVPDLDHTRPFAVLQDAMRREQHTAVGWVVLRTRRHLAALRPYGDGLVLSTLYFADEVLPAPGPSPLAGAEITDREREMARLLVRTLGGPFDPAQFRDEYRERVLQLIEERSPTAVEVAEAAPAPTSSSVEDLLGALKASIDAAKARKSEKGRARGA
ncbi:MAG TPA: Ku protein [Candidatus Dormibacteraeota bacterium]